MKLLDGKTTSKIRLDRLREKIQHNQGRAPGLHVIRIGDDPASEVYVRKKIKTCHEVGILSKEWHLAENVSQEKALDLIKQLNWDETVDGILIQLPLPKTLDPTVLLETVSPEKDVDGFHPYNLGKLLAREPGFVACTPRGIMHLMEEYGIETTGKRAVVVGRSRIVGRPMSLLLDHAGATVTVVHLKTPNPDEICRQADILVVAAGSPDLIGPERIKPGAVVIDVGIHRRQDGKLCGDVQFDHVAPLCSWITPVPGGVGPMTICSLMENTWESFILRQNKAPE